MGLRKEKGISVNLTCFFPTNLFGLQGLAMCLRDLCPVLEQGTVDNSVVGDGYVGLLGVGWKQGVILLGL